MFDHPNQFNIRHQVERLEARFDDCRETSPNAGIGCHHPGMGRCGGKPVEGKAPHLWALHRRYLVCESLGYDGRVYRLLVLHVRRVVIGHGLHGLHLVQGEVGNEDPSQKLSGVLDHTAISRQVGAAEGKSPLLQAAILARPWLDSDMHRTNSSPRAVGVSPIAG
jgi:hypothetical protein